MLLGTDGYTGILGEETSFKTQPKSSQDKNNEKHPVKTSMGGANGAPAVHFLNGRGHVAMAFGGNNQVRSNASHRIRVMP